MGALEGVSANDGKLSTYRYLSICRKYDAYVSVSVQNWGLSYLYTVYRSRVVSVLSGRHITTFYGDNNIEEISKTLYKFPLNLSLSQIEPIIEENPKDCEEYLVTSKLQTDNNSVKLTKPFKIKIFTGSINYVYTTGKLFFIIF